MNDLWGYLVFFKLYFILGGWSWLAVCGASHEWLRFEMRLHWVMPPEMTSTE